MQNTHIVLFKSPRDVQQTDVLGKQLGLGNTQRKWYADATSITCGHLMIDLSPETNALLRYSTDVTSFPTKFYLPSSRSRVTQINDQKFGTLYSKALFNFQHSIPKDFAEVLFKDFITFLCDCCKNHLQGILKGIAKTKLHRLKNIIRKLVSKNASCEVHRFLVASRKEFYLLHLVGQRCIEKILRIDRTWKTSLYYFHSTCGNRENYNFLQMILSLCTLGFASSNASNRLTPAK